MKFIYNLLTVLIGFYVSGKCQQIEYKNSNISYESKSKPINQMLLPNETRLKNLSNNTRYELLTTIEPNIHKSGIHSFIHSFDCLLKSISNILLIYLV